MLKTAMIDADNSAGYLHQSLERARSALYMVRNLAQHVEDTLTRERLHSRVDGLESALAEF